MLGKGLGALIRHYDLNENEVKEQHGKKRTEENKDQDVGRLTVYKKALTQAHADGTVSEDEKLMLDALRQFLMITEDEHELLEEQVLRRSR